MRYPVLTPPPDYSYSKYVPLNNRAGDGMPKQLNNGGYTLLELLVVIIIACILIALIIINVVSK